MADDVAIALTNVSKVFKQYHSPADRLKEIFLPGKVRSESFWALKDINLQVSSGETIGIIGRNGAGKSTLLQIIAGTLQPTAGEVNVNGRVAALLELGSGFNPDFTGHQNIFFNGRILGLSHAEIEERYERIVEFASIGDFIHKPVRTYSSGMFVRLAFAVQANIDASIVIIDEALAVGDVFFRQKCYSRLEYLRSQGAAILLVSHSMPDIQQYCKRAILIDKGIQKFCGPSSEAVSYYYLTHQSDIGGIKLVDGQQTIAGTAERKQFVSPSQADDLPAEAWLDISEKSQIGNGQAVCTGVALCDERRTPCNIFRQGDIAVLHYKFKLSYPIEVPISGILIKNERGTIIYGRDSWQHQADVPTHLEAGDSIYCQQTFKLDISPGDYTFEFGLASIPLDIWQNRHQVSHKEMDASHVRICHLANVSNFSVMLAVRNRVEILTHHGVAKLPGTLKINHFPATTH